MKKLQNNFTTPKQSKRLLELGVPADSANCFYTDKRAMIWVRDETDQIDWGAKVGDVPFYLPCWSACRLMEIIGLCAIFPPHGSTIWYHDEKDYIKSLVYEIEKHTEWFDFSKLEE